MSLIFSHVYDGSLPAGHSVTGATNATVIDQTGVHAASSGPRFTHDLVTGLNPRLLLEPECTQYVLDPSDLSAGQWSLQGGVTSTDAGADGIFWRTEVGSPGAGIDYYRQDIAEQTIAAGQRVTFSVIAEPITPGASYQFRKRFGTGNIYLTGVLGVSNARSSTTSSWSVVDGGEIPLGGGKYLVWGVFEAIIADTTDRILLSPSTGGNPGSAYFYGVNLTNLGFLTSFVTGSSRSADVYASAPLGQSVVDGTLVAETTLPTLTPSGLESLISVESTVSQSSAGLVYDGSTQTLEARYVNNAALQTAGLTTSVNSGPAQTAFAFSANDFAASFAGAPVLSDVSGSVTALDQIVISSALPLGLYSLEVFAERKSNSFLLNPDTVSVELVISGQNIDWASTQSLAASTPAALHLEAIHALITIGSSAAPAVTSQTPEPKSLDLEAYHIMLSAAPLIRPDLAFPRLYAPIKRVSTVQPFNNAKTLNPRP